MGGGGGGHLKPYGSREFVPSAFWLRHWFKLQYEQIDKDFKPISRKKYTLKVEKIIFSIYYTDNITLVSFLLLYYRYLEIWTFP